jgi:hypothetical protein
MLKENGMSKTPVFSTRAEAEKWMMEKLEDEDFHDMFRFSFIDDREGMKKYREIRRDGCCGFFDVRVRVDGRRARIGCNYGH